MLTAQQLADLKLQFGSVLHIRGKNSAWEIVIRKPKRAEWKRVRSMFHNPSQVSDANETLIRQCAVYPTGPDLDNLMDEWPAIPEAVTSCEEFKDLLGLSADQDSK